MLTMKIKVTETEVTVTKPKEKITEGNINQIKCVFDLSEAFDKLIVRASFNGEYVAVENSECYAPILKAGQRKLGVYGYTLEGEKYKLRISPSPCSFFVYSGSFNENDAEATQPEPSELDMHYARIKELVDSGVIKGDKGEKGEQGIQGVQGDQGIQGIKGDKGDQGIQGAQGGKGEPGTTDYTDLEHKPGIDGVKLTPDSTAAGLDLAKRCMTELDLSETTSDKGWSPFGDTNETYIVSASGYLQIGDNTYYVAKGTPIYRHYQSNASKVYFFGYSDDGGYQLYYCHKDSLHPKTYPIATQQDLDYIIMALLDYVIDGYQELLTAGDNITIEDNVISAIVPKAEENWELIRRMEFTQDDSGWSISTDMDGKNFSLEKAVIVIKSIGSNLNTATASPALYINNLNSLALMSSLTVKEGSTVYGMIEIKTKPFLSADYIGSTTVTSSPTDRLSVRGGGINTSYNGTITSVKSTNVSCYMAEGSYIELYGIRGG